MTDDLVERLRSVDVSWSETGEWCAEAADRIEALEAKVERWREALFNAISLIGHSVPMDTTALVAGELLTANNVWHQGRAALGEK